MIGTYLLSFKNTRVVCPPGKLTPGHGRLILVPTIMRSGTHLLIDMILNNFSVYRRKPLYVDFDRLLDQPQGRNDRVEQLLCAGAYVVKTHYPQVYCEREREVYLQRVAENSHIITVDRNPEHTFRSSSGWGQSIAEHKRIYQESVQRFKSFWANREMLRLSFPRLIDPAHHEKTVSLISNYIQVPNGEPLLGPLPAKHRFQIYISKAMTRLLGRYAPIINTTIRFSSSD